ncbi:MAG: phenylalanine--tRNA ligase subunit beta [Candidatus Marinimicrobia bacterium]|nr:phenylalanine--tRNA ligase subunit beta [Candidatus Neomarinimicrobiota bacterium]MBT7581168.1 phenylalanine--tRNA ligase subunit beta [Candidatus Neomarinimicrobiota bacterium]
MKVSLSWLKRFVDFEYSSSELADKLTMQGFESEVLTDFSSLQHIVVGEVKSAEKHPDADKLKVCTVTDGNDSYNVVCGAPNVDKGQKIVFAKVGAVLPGDFKIGKAKIRGVESFGMICSERELGISEEHDGIMVLDNSCEVGVNIDSILGEAYDAIDVEITPDKAFALSHRGIAREVAAMLGAKLKTPIEVSKIASKGKDLIKVSLDKDGGCTRYIAGIMKNLTVGPSPKWLADYLKSAGQKSINNLVDISNFMLLEIGHPTHIFDLNKLSKPTIEVKWAKKGEKFDALDEESYKLDTDHLVVTDSVNTIALAGIIGGKDSAVSDTTTEVLIESAYFNPVVIRKGSKKLNLLSEASRRFERGADPEATLEAFYMIVGLMTEVAGGTLESLITDESTIDTTLHKVSLSEDKLLKYTGQEIDSKSVGSILDGLYIGYDKSKTGWDCIIPSFRHDVVYETDLIEEILRCYGYENIKSSYSFSSQMQYANDEEQPLFELKQYLSSLGFNQCYNNSLQDIQEVKAFGITPVSVMNPSSERMNTLRTTLHRGLLENLDFNFKNGSSNTLIYEHGTVFEKKGDTLKDIDQVSNFSCLVHGNFYDKGVHFDGVENNFFLLKGIATNAFQTLTKAKVKFVEDKSSYCDVFYRIVDNKKNTVGSIGSIADSFLDKLDIAHKTDVCVMDINTTFFTEHFNHSVKVKDIILYPVVTRDLNFKLDSGANLGEVCSAMKSVNQSILQDVWPIDIYQSKEEKSKKNVLFKLSFQNIKKTLEDNEVNAIIAQIISIVTKKFNAKLRDN